MADAGGEERVRLSELVAALSLATDIGLGQPMEHLMRSCLIATRLGERMGLSDEDRAATYYTTLLVWVGCTAESGELAALFGDDIAFRAASYDLDRTGLPLLGFMLRHVGAGAPPLKRARLTATLMVTGGRPAAELMLTHCRVSSSIAARLGVPRAATEAIRFAFARWDGKGMPSGLAGDDLPLPLRIAHVADAAEVQARTGGVERAVAFLRRRAGGQLDPQVVDVFCDCAGDLVAAVDEEDGWDAVIRAEPVLSEPLAEPELERALEALADFCDLKSHFFAGHSRGVADLAHAALVGVGAPPRAARELRLAGLIHDLGRTGVPNTIWDKPGPLTAAEKERVRLHPYYTDRMLRRPAVLARLAAVASAHHERLDGSGYPRGIASATVPLPGRVLAVADVYHALTEPRPHRPARVPQQAADEVGAEVRAGRLDAEAADAVLAAAGHRVRSRRRARPAGLTAREVEVLILLARGASNREVARRLVIATKTASNHVERIYAKTGSSTRAEATLFAMRHGLLETLEPLGPEGED